MKIQSITVPADYLGLVPGRLSGFGDVVLLAGPNGAGKTRLLRLIQQYAGGALLATERVRIESEREALIQQITHRRAQAEAAETSGMAPDSPQVVNLLNVIPHWEATLRQYTQQLESDEILERDSPLKPVVVSYDVERTALRDWKDINQREVQSLAANVSGEFSVRIISDAGLSAVRTLVNRYVYASHGNSPERLALERDVERLKGLVREFLGTELGWDSDGDPTLFGLPIANAGLSSGQLVLLQVAISLFFQKGDRNELVLLMDEPERHLHPLATLTMIDEVRRKCPNAQLWIATHSLHILAHANPNDIWFVKDGAVEHAGKKSLEVLHSLVGGDSGVDELLEFVSLPARNALLYFAAQCLLPPPVVDTEVGDPQTTQIARALATLRPQGRPLRILDFGIGKGRLLSELLDAVSRGDAHFQETFDYFGLDQFSTLENRKVCEERLAAAYDDQRERYFISFSDLANSLDSGSFDVVVLCNTLHEIPPEDWLLYFGENGRVSRILRAEGHLLVVEDQLLPAGERAHRYGYLVLDAAELRALTGTSNEDPRFLTLDSPIARYQGRLKAHVIPAAYLRRVSAASRLLALRVLKERSLDSANGLSGEQFDTRRAKRFAFWCHQHVNAALAVQALSGE